MLNTFAICPASPFPFRPLKGHNSLDPSTYLVDGHHNHNAQVRSWLDFIIQAIRQDDRKRVPLDLSLQVWKYLIENPVFPSDRETGLRWFTKVRVHIQD